MHKLVFFLCLLFLAASCSTFYVPASPMESPEALGPTRFGRIEPISLIAGTDLISTPTPQPTNPETGKTPAPRVGSVIAQYALSFSMRVGEKSDLGLKIPIGSAPTLRFKYQVIGQTESEVSGSGFALSLYGELGTAVGPTQNNSDPFGLKLGGGGAILGYRYAQNQLIALAPSLTIFEISGVNSPAKSGTQYGIALGYQLEFGQVFLRAEVAYVLGNYGEYEIQSISPSLALGATF